MLVGAVFVQYLIYAVLYITEAIMWNNFHAEEEQVNVRSDAEPEEAKAPVDFKQIELQHEEVKQEQANE